MIRGCSQHEWSSLWWCHFMRLIAIIHYHLLPSLCVFEGIRHETRERTEPVWAVMAISWKVTRVLFNLNVARLIMSFSWSLSWQIDTRTRPPKKIHVRPLVIKCHYTGKCACVPQCGDYIWQYNKLWLHSQMLSVVILKWLVIIVLHRKCSGVWSDEWSLGGDHCWCSQQNKTKFFFFLKSRGILKITTLDSCSHPPLM